MSFFDFYGRAVVMFKLMQMPNKNISSHEMTIANRDFIISDFDFIISSHEMCLNEALGQVGATPHPISEALAHTPGHHDEGSATHSPSQIYVPKSKKT